MPEVSSAGISLEVDRRAFSNAKIISSALGAERYQEFLSFKLLSRSHSMHEGDTPLVTSCERMRLDCGIRDLWLKDETRNPTGSFKDRGTAAVAAFSLELGETTLATISTGNMGHSVAAYAARLGLQALVFVPHYAPISKLIPMVALGAKVIRVGGESYAVIKNKILKRADETNLRLVSGNGPIRTEGYKITAFELFEQMGDRIPDYVVIPTSAGGHLRGVFKGFLELQAAGYIEKLPRMVIAQAERCNPIVAGIEAGLDSIVPVANVETIAEAISGGNPPGADELVQKAHEYQWLAGTVDEETIMREQAFLGSCGFFVEPSTAVGYGVLRRLVGEGKIDPESRVVLILTGSGLKDPGPGWESDKCSMMDLNALLSNWNTAIRQ